MEDFKKIQERDKDIVFSKSVKAGKRIYYVDVKKRNVGNGKEFRLKYIN